MNAIYDAYLKQSRHILASHECEKDWASWSEHVQQSEQEFGAFCMGLDDEAPDPNGRDAWVDSALAYDGDHGWCACLGGAM